MAKAALTVGGSDQNQLQSPQSPTEPEPGEAQGFGKLQKLSRKKKSDVVTKKFTQILLLFSPPPKGLGRNMKEISAAAYQA